VGGFVFKIAGSSVSYLSKKQLTVVTSLVEAEYIASSNLLTELNYSQVSATIIHANNQGCITLTYNSVNHSYEKHINIKHHFICKYMKHSEVKLKYISTKNILVDIFTKQDFNKEYIS